MNNNAKSDERYVSQYMSNIIDNMFKYKFIIFGIVVGCIGSKTPLRYNLTYRNYFYVTQGKINIKLICPQNSRYLYPIKDYDNFE